MRLRIGASVLSLVALGALAGLWAGSGGAASAPAPAAVSLVLPEQTLYPGESVPVTVVNDTAHPIYQSNCVVLARRTSRGWDEVTRSHGVNVACAIWAGRVLSAHSRQTVGLQLYDDLRPGSYRITLDYRLVPTHWKELKALTRHDQFARLTFAIGVPPAIAKPHLSEKRILRLAMAAARRAGDSHPTLVQHAAGTHFRAVLIGQGDLVFEWNWSYLIAIRGHFTYSGLGPANATIRGTVITLVVDAATGQVTDSGLSKRYPPLARLGKVTTDLRR
jgi:hypothetical protein